MRFITWRLIISITFVARNDNLWFPFFSALTGKRHMVTFMIFLGMANAYIMRTNMSVAIVAMVNHTSIQDSEKVEKVVNECGDLITNETEAAQRVSTESFMILPLSEEIAYARI